MNIFCFGGYIKENNISRMENLVKHRNIMKMPINVFSFCVFGGVFSGRILNISGFSAKLESVYSAKEVVSSAEKATSGLFGVEDGLLARRSFVTFTSAVAFSALLPTEPAIASGGATAGKYTTIPIAKRRYYGRVQQAVHEFLDMGSAVVSADMTDPTIQHFFDTEGTVIVEARNQSINGQCTKKNQSCKGAEVRDSRYNDMKATMYLLGNAFRINQQKAPDNLPTVRAAKAFFKEMDKMEKNVKKKPKKKDVESVKIYATALELLDTS